VRQDQQQPGRQWCSGAQQHVARDRRADVPNLVLFLPASFVFTWIFYTAPSRARSHVARPLHARPTALRISRPTWRNAAWQRRAQRGGMTSNPPLGGRRLARSAAPCCCCPHRRAALCSEARRGRGFGNSSSPRAPTVPAVLLVLRTCSRPAPGRGLHLDLRHNLGDADLRLRASGGVGRRRSNSDRERAARWPLSAVHRLSQTRGRSELQAGAYRVDECQKCGDECGAHGLKFSGGKVQSGAGAEVGSAEGGLERV
jgi:hypothetical protein